MCDNSKIVSFRVIFAVFGRFFGWRVINSFKEGSLNILHLIMKFSLLEPAVLTVCGELRILNIDEKFEKLR